MTFFPALLLMLIGLKLAGVLTCSWFWIFLPAWVVPAIMLVLFGIVYLLAQIGD